MIAIPEFDTLLKTLIIILLISYSLRNINNNDEKNKMKTKINISSLCSERIFFIEKMLKIKKIFKQDNIKQIIKFNS